MKRKLVILGFVHVLLESMLEIIFPAYQWGDANISRVIDIFKGVIGLHLAKLSEKQKGGGGARLRGWERLYLDGGIFYHGGWVCGQSVAQLVLPEVFRDVVFTGLLDEAGHQGRDRTVFLWNPSFIDRPLMLL